MLAGVLGGLAWPGRRGPSMRFSATGERCWASRRRRGDLCGRDHRRHHRAVRSRQVRRRDSRGKHPHADRHSHRVLPVSVPRRCRALGGPVGAHHRALGARHDQCGQLHRWSGRSRRRHRGHRRSRVLRLHRPARRRRPAAPRQPRTVGRGDRCRGVRGVPSPQLPPGKDLHGRRRSAAARAAHGRRNHLGRRSEPGRVQRSNVLLLRPAAHPADDSRRPHRGHRSSPSFAGPQPDRALLRRTRATSTTG